MIRLHQLISMIVIILVMMMMTSMAEEELTQCSQLRSPLYTCESPVIDSVTYEAMHCQKPGIVNVTCTVKTNVQCNGERSWVIEKPCRLTNGYRFTTAMALSVILGVFGVDRFYLGYPAIGLFKLCTAGFFFIGYVVDVILISLQIVGPSDGSALIMTTVSARMEHLVLSDATYQVPIRNDIGEL